MKRTSVPTNRHLADGRRLRIRMIRGSDRNGLAALLQRTGPHTDTPELRDLVHFDPRERAVLCASMWTGQHAVIVGYTAGSRADGRSDILLADEQMAPGVGETLEAFLIADIRARDQRAA